ncbi:hypothetical protein LCGC14_0841660 [marine sediment metagenome]|uniref:Uncharacterized protein n=1 Tax=marine sediment metagenome TaxID=412755 RepID=A0A0F9SK83_9ZZZZ
MITSDRPKLREICPGELKEILEQHEKWVFTKDEEKEK